MKNECIRARELIVDAMIRRLPPLKNAELSEHLGECDPCRAEFIDMRNEMILLTQTRTNEPGLIVRP